MSSKAPLNDTWFFWNPERLEDFPHLSNDDYVGGTAGDGGEEAEPDPPRLAMLEDLMLYVGGVSAAMLGVALVILIGSFISAYSALNGPVAAERTALPSEPYLSLQRPAPPATALPPEAVTHDPAGSAAIPEGELSPARGTDPPRGAAAI